MPAGAVGHLTSGYGGLKALYVLGGYWRLQCHDDKATWGLVGRLTERVTGDDGRPLLGGPHENVGPNTYTLFHLRLEQGLQAGGIPLLTLEHEIAALKQ